MQSRREVSFIGAVALALIAMGAPLVWPSAARAALSCSGVGGTVIIRNFTVEPAQPRVGDEVTISFDATINVYSFQSVYLHGASPFFSGDARHFTRDTVFHLQAAQAGTARIAAGVVYHTEDQCVDDETGESFFREGATIDAQFDEHAIVILAAEPTSTPTPTPTPSPQPTFTATPVPSDGGGGCEVGGHGSSLWPLALVLVPLLPARRREVRK